MNMFLRNVGLSTNYTPLQARRPYSSYADRTSKPKNDILICIKMDIDRLCGLVVRVLGYRSGGPGSIPGTTKKK
jgi:hypothetical protein